MKTFLSILLVCTLMISGCGRGEEENAASKVAIAWVNAEIQQNEAKMLDLLDKKSRALDADDEADHTFVIKHYRLTEWKASDARSFFEVVFEHPETGRLGTERMEVIKTDQGWKRTTYADLHDFETKTMDLKPQVVKEMYEQ